MHLNIKSFIQILDPVINTYVQQKLQEGMLWPEPLIQLNPLFAPGELIDELVVQGTLYPECAKYFAKRNLRTMIEVILYVSINTSPKPFLWREVAQAMS